MVTLEVMLDGNRFWGDDVEKQARLWVDASYATLSLAYAHARA
jgi:hypothetical protein